MLSSTVTNIINKGTISKLAFPSTFSKLNVNMIKSNPLINQRSFFSNQSILLDSAKNKKEPFCIDLSKTTPETRKKYEEITRNIFNFNHTMPNTKEYIDLMHKVFPKMGKNSFVAAPVSGAVLPNVTIGNNVYINTNALFMAAGGITIDDDVQIASNCQLISNNHDLKNRQIITCFPVHIKRNAWIGGGSTILPGITIGENAVVGAGSVVTKDVEDNTIVAGNPAKVIRKIED